MKASHFTTPRSMADGQWSYNADPIERQEYHQHDKIVIRASLIALIALVAILLWS